MAAAEIGGGRRGVRRGGDGRDGRREHTTVHSGDLAGYCKQRSNRHAVMSCPFLALSILCTPTGQESTAESLWP